MAPGASGSETVVGLQEDAVPEVTRWHVRKRLDAVTWQWRDEATWLPRVTRERLREAPELYSYVAVVTACLLGACCLSCCLASRDRIGAIRFTNNIGRCRWLLSNFMHGKEFVVRLSQCLWRFEAMQGKQYDDLLIYLTQELQEVHDTEQRQLFHGIGYNPLRARRLGNLKYLEREVAKLQWQKRKRRAFRILGM